MIAESQERGEGGLLPALVRVLVDVDDGAAALRIDGEFDIAATAAASDGLRQVIGAGKDLVVIDLEHTTFADSSALRFLVEATKTGREKGIEVAIVANAHIRRLVEIVGLRDVLEIVDARPHGGPSR